MNALLKKLKIKTPHRLCTVNAPANFKAGLGELPDGVSISKDPQRAFDSLHWFVKTKSEVDAQTKEVLALIKNKEGVIVWCYYPKGSSKIQTDLTRDKGWDTVLKHPEIKWLNLISFDDTWSTFAFRLQTEKDKRIDAQPKEREIFKYADSATKTIRLPEDVAKAFVKNKKAKELFEALAFSHRREYIEWIVTAKREETRTTRINSTIEKLLEGKKNPADK